MMAGSTLGYSRTPRNVNPITPNTTIAMLITIVRMGRWMQVEERLTSPPLLRGECHRGAGLELENAGGDERVAGRNAVDDFHALLGAKPGLDRARLGLAAAEQEHLLSAQLGHQRE